MRIGHNLSAVNTNNSLKVLAKKNEKIIGNLSSGYRINCAADDAAGLAISEKMRGQIRGLHQASRNAQDGISLIQTAEGALGEVHDILKRINELSVQAANDTYTEDDKNKIQKEINEMVKEIDNISSNTEFNGMKLLDGTMTEDATSLSSSQSGTMTLQDLLNSHSNNLNLIYIDQTDDFQTTKSGTGAATISGYTSLKNVLQTEIVPQAVTSILSAFSPAFNYLSASSIGIGLKLYSDASSTTLASVSLGYGVYGGGTLDSTMLTYQLAVNMASLTYDGNGQLTDASRKALETTIVHEMIHGYMDEALTNGMIGVTNGAKDAANSYPAWFKEGMAQSAAGGYANCNDWVNGGIGITTSTPQANISTIVTNSSNSLASGTTASKYATGYLACMYLGYLAGGSSNVVAADISNGLGKVLSDLIGGKSLDTVIKERTGGKYTSVSDFESKFGDSDSSSFIYRLTQIVGSTGNGGIVTGNLSDSDLLPNMPASTLLFSLDTTNDTVKNIYPNDVNVLSGGGRSNAGTAPVGDYSSTIGGGDNPPPINPGSTIDLSNIASIDGISYNSDLNVLTINKSGDYTLTGVNTTGVRVVVQDGVNANITLNNAKINTSNGAGMSLEGNANVTLSLVGNNSVITSKERAAGIRVTTGATLNIQGNGALDAESWFSTPTYIGAGIGGGYGEDGGNIIINGGNITAKCKGLYAAGIGGGEHGSGGNITINGGNINAIAGGDGIIGVGSSGAGIGGGTGGNGGNITITGGSVNAISKGMGAGIGNGDYATGGTIKITGGTIAAEAGEQGAGIGGGGQGGAIGAITISGGTITAKGGEQGAGIGSGSHGVGEHDKQNITISGGNITATGGDEAAGIGGGTRESGGKITITGGIITAEGGNSPYGNGGAGIGGGCNGDAGIIDINGESVIVKAKGNGHSDNIGGGTVWYGGTPVTGGTVNKTAGIIFEGNSGGVYGNVTLGGPLDCDGRTLTVRGGAILTVLNGGKIINHGSFTNSGRIENHGVIGSVSGTGITHHYATGIIKHIKEPTTATAGESLASSISALSPSSITVAYNGTTRTLTGTWSVADMDGNPITDLSGTIAGDNKSYKYSVTFTSEDGIYFDPLNMSLYAMKGSNAQASKYETISDEYVSASGPGGGGSILTYSYVVNGSPAVVVPPGPIVPPGPVVPTGPVVRPSNPDQRGITGGISIQLGANANQSITIKIGSIKSHDLGIYSLSVLTHDDTEKAIDACYKAINKVSGIRSSLGAYQNMLEHAIDSLDNTEENLQDAESRIRDMDMVKGIIEHSKYQILLQTAQAMLAQENLSSKSVLSLLS